MTDLPPKTPSISEAIDAVLNPDIRTAFVDPDIIAYNPRELTYKEIMQKLPNPPELFVTDITAKQLAIELVCNKFPEKEWTDSHTATLIVKTQAYIEQHSEG